MRRNRRNGRVGVAAAALALSATAASASPAAECRSGERYEAVWVAPADASQLVSRIEASIYCFDTRLFQFHIIRVFGDCGEERPACLWSSTSARRTAENGGWIARLVQSNDTRRELSFWINGPFLYLLVKTYKQDGSFRTEMTHLRQQ